MEPLDTENGNFSVHGFLDVKEPRSIIRVRDLNAPFTQNSNELSDVSVYIDDLISGTAYPLTLEIQELDGYRHNNFIFDASVLPDNDYQLRIERSGRVLYEQRTKTPTYPVPVISPLNKSCYAPVEVEFSPTNGGTIVMQIGLVQSDTLYWSAPKLLKPEFDGSVQKISYAFIPDEMISEILPTSIVLPCAARLPSGTIYVRYIHYAQDYYETLFPESFSLIGSVRRFGSLYTDTLSVPLNTSLSPNALVHIERHHDDAIGM